jgi:hypothetical protein
MHPLGNIESFSGCKSPQPPFLRKRERKSCGELGLKTHQLVGDVWLCNAIRGRGLIDVKITLRIY